MKKLAIRAAMLVALMSSATAYAVPILSFDNAMSDVSRILKLGDTLSVDLWISGLDLDDLGGFDFDVNFNAAVTNLANASKNTALTEFDIFEVTPAANQVLFEGVSLFADLTLQADAFRLATFSFVASSIGTSILMLDPELLSDALGIRLDVQTFVANVTVTAPVSNPIPAPQPWLLLMAGGGLLYLRRRHGVPV